METPEGRGDQETSLVFIAGDQTGGLGLTGGSTDGEKWREGRAGGGEESGLTAWIWGCSSCTHAGSKVWRDHPEVMLSSTEEGN